MEILNIDNQEILSSSSSDHLNDTLYNQVTDESFERMEILCEDEDLISFDDIPEFDDTLCEVDFILRMGNRLSNEGKLKIPPSRYASMQITPDLTNNSSNNSQHNDNDLDLSQEDLDETTTVIGDEYLTENEECDTTMDIADMDDSFNELTAATFDELSNYEDSNESQDAFEYFNNDSSRISEDSNMDTSFNDEDESNNLDLLDENQERIETIEILSDSEDSSFDSHDTISLTNSERERVFNDLYDSSDLEIIEDFEDIIEIESSYEDFNQTDVHNNSRILQQHNDIFDDSKTLSTDDSVIFID